MPNIKIEGKELKQLLNDSEDAFSLSRHTSLETKISFDTINNIMRELALSTSEQYSLSPDIFDKYKQI